MTRFIFLVGLFFSTHAFAGAVQDCMEYKTWQIAQSLNSSNLANIITTRTPDGGPYKPFEYRITDQGCILDEPEMARLAAHPIWRYEPEHPDAYPNGYVAYPNIDLKVAEASSMIISKKLAQLKAQGACAEAGSEISTEIFTEQPH
jgi:flagellar basal-body rod protein FlgC